MKYRTEPPKLLNDDGTASMATMLLLSHHAFRRDIARFLRALAEMKDGDISRLAAICEEWEKSYRQALHGHHTAEDTNIFPDMRKKHPELASALDTLTEQHHLIDPVIAKIDATLADPAHLRDAEIAFMELKVLLDKHLEFEEAQITPALRDQKDFPAPADEDMAAVYAQGFSWSMQGIAPEVLDQVKKLLPDMLLSRLPAAQVEFEVRSERVWGSYQVGSATTSVPAEY